MSQEIEPSIDKWNYICAKVLCKARETIERMNGQCLE